MKLPKANEAIDFEREHGKEFVKSLLPEAVIRTGCLCCYGDGPDLKCEYIKQDDGSMDVVWTVDFDFKRPDYADSNVEKE